MKDFLTLLTEHPGAVFTAPSALLVVVYSHCSRLGSREMLMLCQVWLTLPQLQDVKKRVQSFNPVEGPHGQGRRSAANLFFLQTY